MRQYIAVCVLIFSGLIAAASTAHAVYGPGDVVEDFCLPDSNGDTICLSDYPNHVIILNWWRDT